MEGKAWGYTGLRMGGIGCYSRWVPGSTGMAGVPLVQSLKSIMCFERAIHMIGALAVLADGTDRSRIELDVH